MGSVQLHSLALPLASSRRQTARRFHQGCPPLPQQVAMRLRALRARLAFLLDAVMT
jgi:transcriptional regulator GlxA family with amidase domain